tara:strand:+ start:779 stop:1615 length:837 start_codon:yes stop_codon:yes gene_type:complete
MIKFIKFFVILFFSLNIFAIPGFNDKGAIKSILETCSSTEVRVISNLYVGKDLDKRCLVEEFNKVFKKDSHKNWFASEYQTKINDYNLSQFFKLDYKHTPKINSIKSVTSIWSSACGEICKPAQDYLYEVESKFWYLIADSDAGSDMSVLKIDEKGNPQLIFWVGYDHSRRRNHLIHLVKEKEFVLGSGRISITDINLEEIKYHTSGSKSYFIEGGAFWYDSETTFNFSNETGAWKYINAQTSNCMQKEVFLKAVGWTEIPIMIRGVNHIKGKVCYIQ